MKLRNKKTGEIVDLIEIVRIDGTSNEFYLRLSDKVGRTFKVGFNSLADLNEEWEDYEEPKEYWYIDINGEIMFDNVEDDTVKVMREIGNFFTTREEAEKAVEKLKAWKRLKDGGLVIKKWSHTPDMYLTTGSFLKIEGFIPAIMKNMKDLDLLFGGEE